MTRNEFGELSKLRESVKAEEGCSGSFKIARVFYKTGDTAKKGTAIVEYYDPKYTNLRYYARTSINGRVEIFFNPGETFKKDDVIAVVEDKKKLDFYESKFEEYEKLVNEHRTEGDLIPWWVKERDSDYAIHAIIMGYATEDEIEMYSQELKKHIDELILEHKNKGDFYDWFFSLEEKDNIRYNLLYTRKDVIELLREKYGKEIAEHRAKGDLVEYILELSENMQLCNFILYKRYDCDIPKYFQKNKKFEFCILRQLLLGDEKEEIGKIDCIFDSLSRGFFIDVTNPYADDFNYIYKLSCAPKDSIKRKRYELIRSKISNSEKLAEHDKLIKKESVKHTLIKYSSIAGGVLLLALIGLITINRINTKDARLAKQEAQRIEKVKVKNAKNLVKAQQNDLSQIEKMGSKKIDLLQLFISTPEPSLYVIAPMSYDTKKFVEDNSHDKTLFGTKDNSAERLTILESCITDFQNKVDIKTGVSFLDRSKIEQIEREHKFQLGDWSNNTKTAEVGKALNANILLFLDKFGFIDSGSGEYHFEAKFVDINTMQSASFNIVYSNAKKKIITPATVETISFRDFSSISTKKNPFEDELALKTIKTLRTVQKKDMKETSPLGDIVKIELSEYDGIMPKSNLYEVSTLSFDGFGSVEISSGSNSENASYSFEPVEMNLIKSGNDYYTDGKIGTLTIESEAGYKKHDVFTQNNREYYLKLNSAETEKITVNYYLQMVRQ